MMHNDVLIVDETNKIRTGHNDERRSTFELIRYSVGMKTLAKSSHVVYVEFSGSIVFIEMLKSRSNYNHWQLKSYLSQIGDRYSYFILLGMFQSHAKNYVHRAIKDILSGKDKGYILGY